MNETDTLACEELFKKLISIPIAGVLWKYRPELSSHSEKLSYYLETISLKLNQNMFDSPEQFLQELRGIFEMAKTDKKKKNIYHIAATILSEEFERILKENPITSSTLTDKTNIISDYFEMCIEKLKEQEEKAPQSKQPNLTPAASILYKDPKTFTADDLSFLISITKDPEIIMSIAKESKQLQPETISLGQQDLTFHFCLMNEETIHNVAAFAIEEIKKNICSFSDKNRF